MINIKNYQKSMSLFSFTRHALSLISLVLLLLLPQPVFSQAESKDLHDNLRQKYSPAIELLKDLINKEMGNNHIPSIAIALVEDQQIIWASAFGYPDPDKKIPATVKTKYRIGSVSKLFTDIAIMQKVESGELNIDAPITKYLPSFNPENPYKKEITLRQLMSHRSGLIREPPVGNYFDPTEPTLHETVESLIKTKLVFEPESGIKYSNAAIAVTGYLLEKLENKPFADILRKAVLEPLGMTSSSFVPEKDFSSRLAKGIMWTIDGTEFPAPAFELGEAPAGSMYSTVEDLGLFICVLLNGGKGKLNRILKPETLKEMWAPQFIDVNSKWDNEIGLGFNLKSNYSGRLRVRHGGAIYGFSTELSVLPEDKFGVVVVSSKGSINDVNRNIADSALNMMIAIKENKPLPELKFANMSNRRLIEAIETLSGTTGKSGSNDGFGGLTGHYGWDHNILSIYEHEGNLYAHIEYFYIYKLTQINEDVFQFSKFGLYSHEEVVFLRDASGKAISVSIGGRNGVVFKRRN
jgi:serine beta-lactamase-like protein LACTB